VVGSSNHCAAKQGCSDRNGNALSFTDPIYPRPLREAADNVTTF
jgi:hypothetical protein